MAPEPQGEFSGCLTPQKNREPSQVEAGSTILS